MKQFHHMKLPSKQDFYFDGGCDERYAIEKFLSKSNDDVVKMCKNYTPLSLADTFYHVGIRAFNYYAFGFLEYIKEALETKDKEMHFESASLLLCILDIIEHHISKSPNELRQIAFELYSALQDIKNHPMFDNIHKDNEEKLDSIISKLEDLQQ